MSYAKKQFSIKDLEILSGIKAHTLRMWEKRYEILSPQRTETNIRSYGLKDLQKLLNISFLNENGYKISRISKLDNKEIESLVKSISSTTNNKDKALKSFTLSMYNFDQNLFFDTYNSLLKTKTFREIFQETFIPLLKNIGMLWQINSIHPIHEHFLTNLIKRKLILNIEKLQQQKPQKTDSHFVLFLPENEVHDLGILYTNYEILLHGYPVTYLGNNLPMEDLIFLGKIYQNIRFVSYFTVAPDHETAYLEEFQLKIISQIDCEFWVLGPRSSEINMPPSKKIKVMKTIEELVRKL
ncbi:MerR family transcriptional regulator [Mesonia aestuariivivens]|uniref:MerR family transcriptional regulator n=1 Tax=Mesonia aestuariivivens TaxID=2796128 RepID=A0ABS6W1H2_9FLAO|nr:MerR family transcriptional regulator [Mesonia aestuariivivens]MBW2961698.1 MerR family transcriptional regulator [Mesonia aestuariivivens]